MSRFDELFQSMGFPVLVDEFGEREGVVYLPFNGDARPISAIIDRSPPAQFEAVDNTRMGEVLISVFNDCETGISSTELNVGGDRVLISLRKGKEPQSRLIALLEDDSGGVCVLRVA